MGELPEQQGNNYPTYKIRSSYNGKKGKPKYYKDGKDISIPYALNLLSTYDRSKTLYITEGETDTITLIQAGFNAIGIPGANSFKEEYVRYLETFATIMVVLDSDTAGDNLLKSIIGYLKEGAVRLFFIPMPAGIKDVNTFHCSTCHKDIKKFEEEFKKLAPIPATLEGFKLLVESFPDSSIVNSYMINNYIKHIIGGDKIEIDKFTKAMYDLQGKDLGISRTTIKDVAKSAIAAVLRESEEANEELSIGLGENLISKGEDCYLYQRLSANGVSYEPFTSFTIKVVRRELLDNGEVQSIWRLENNNGRVQEITIGALARTSQVEFSKLVNTVDGFMYRVPPIAGFHSMFMYYVEKDVICPVFARCYTVGKHNEEWLFDEYGVDKKGEVHYVENGSYNLDGVNYLPPLDSMPRELYRSKVNMVSPARLEDEEVITLLNMLDINQGSKIAWAVLGWIGACFAKDIIQGCGYGFPVCYVTGNAQAGKTTLAKWMLKAAGFNNITALGAKSSVFGINLLASVYGNLPLWFDDIRSLGEEGIWNSIILGAYENSGDLKGTKDRSLTNTLPYNSGLLITSEFFVKSPAAQSRCLQLVADSTVQDRTLFSEINKEVDKVLPTIGASAIVKLQKGELDFAKTMEEYRVLLADRGVNSRFAQNYAVVIAGFKLMFGDYVKEDNEIWSSFVKYIADISNQNNKEVTSNSYAQELVKDIAEMLQDRVYKDIYKCGEQWVIRDNFLILSTAGLYDTWRKYKGINNTGDYNTRREFVAQLRRLPFAIRNSAGTAKINNKVVTVIKLDLEKMKAVDDIEINTIPDLLRAVDTSEFF